MPSSTTTQPDVDIATQTMRDVYEQIKTPYKYGVALRNPGVIIDCPAV